MSGYQLAATVFPVIIYCFGIGEEVLPISLAKIMATISDFNGSERLGREGNLYQGGARRNLRRGVGLGK